MTDDADIVREAFIAYSNESELAVVDDALAALDRLVAERDECRKAFKIGHSTLMRMQARAETAEASLDKAVRDLRDQMEARDRLETELADAHELAIAPVSLHDALARAEAAEARVTVLEAALPPAPESVPQWGVPDWREWARTTRAALAKEDTDD